MIARRDVWLVGSVSLIAFLVALALSQWSPCALNGIFMRWC